MNEMSHTYMLLYTLFGVYVCISRSIVYQDGFKYFQDGFKGIMYTSL